MPKPNKTPHEHCLGELRAYAQGDAAEQFAADTRPLEGASASDQVVFLNRYWRRRLAGMKTDTISAREALLDNCTPDEWCSLFTRYVLPVIAQHTS